MNYNRFKSPARHLAAALLIAFPGGVNAITVAELQAELAEGSRITLIDVRTTAEFSSGHIVSAINIPADLCAAKKLPPLGRVVAYGGGLGKERVREAALELSQKPGLEVDILEGGYAAWRTAAAATTDAGGLKDEALAFITYDQVKSIEEDNAVLIDLRPAQSQLQSVPSESLTDLTKEFPGIPVARSAFDLPRQRQSASGSVVPPLLVLIDSGDGRAELLARALRAGGNQRVVILAGGEAIIKRKGRPGLQRQGQSFEGSFPVPPPEPVQNAQ